MKPATKAEGTVYIRLRLAADVANGIRATCPDYKDRNARVEKVLREASAKGKL